MVARKAKEEEPMEKRGIPEVFPTLRRKYRVRLTEDLLGTTPMDKEIYKNFIQTKKDEAIAAGKLVAAPKLNGEVEEPEVEADFVRDLEEKGTTGFLIDQQKGLFVYDYWMKGYFKSAANTLREILKYPGLKQKVTNNLFVAPRKLYLGGKMKADDIIERPLRFMTARGERVALASSEILLAGLEFEFTVILLPHKEVTLELANFLLQYGQLMGLGQWRNGGYGRFEVIMIDGQPTEAAPKLLAV
jgi:hypothetical protein